MGEKQRISYVPLEDMTPEMRAEMERCAREGTPRPESSAIRAHVPAAFWFFAESWQNLVRDGILDHDIKELCRVYVSRSVKCEYCGNQRSEKGKALGLVEGQYDDLMNFERSEIYDDRQKAALAYAEAITWHLDTDDPFWDRMNPAFHRTRAGRARLFRRSHHGSAELAPTSQHRPPRGDARGTEAAMAPGFEDADSLAKSKSSEGYWAKV